MAPERRDRRNATRAEAARAFFRALMRAFVRGSRGDRALAAVRARSQILPGGMLSGRQADSAVS
jgi:hypothetical protein